MSIVEAELGWGATSKLDHRAAGIFLGVGHGAFYHSFSFLDTAARFVIFVQPWYDEDVDEDGNDEPIEDDDDDVDYDDDEWEQKFCSPGPQAFSLGSGMELLIISACLGTAVIFVLFVQPDILIELGEWYNEDADDDENDEPIEDHDDDEYDDEWEQDEQDWDEDPEFDTDDEPEWYREVRREIDEALAF